MLSQGTGVVAPSRAADVAPPGGHETRLGSTAEGLSQAEAERRLAQHGANALPEHAANPLLRLLFLGTDPLDDRGRPRLSALVRHWEDLGIILFCWSQTPSSASGRSTRRGTPSPRSRRAGADARVGATAPGPLPARELVPGDVSGSPRRYRAGRRPPTGWRSARSRSVRADGRVAAGDAQRRDRVLRLHHQARARAMRLSTATGAQTYFGKTAAAGGGGAHGSHFQRAVLQIGDYLIVLAIVLVALILGVVLFRGDSSDHAAVCPGVDGRRRSRGDAHRALGHDGGGGALLAANRRSSAGWPPSRSWPVWTCSARTRPAPLRRTADARRARCSAEAWRRGGDPCAALASRAEDQDPIDLAVLSGRSRRAALPTGCSSAFDPVHKRTEAEVAGPDGYAVRVSKGAPQVILALVRMLTVRAPVEAAVNAFAARGFRSLGVARAEGEGPWRSGRVAALRPAARRRRATLQTARQMGIRVTMVTGDQAAIAREVARQVGLGTTS